MYNDTITVFNRCETLDGIVWYPSVISNVDFNADRANIVATYGGESAENATLHIRCDADNVIECKYGRKPFMYPKEWRNLYSDVMQNYITFSSGTNFDFFMLGEWPSEEPISDDAYVDGFYNYLNRYRDNVYAITKMAIFSVIPHIEIMGK